MENLIMQVRSAAIEASRMAVTETGDQSALQVETHAVRAPSHGDQRAAREAGMDRRELEDVNSVFVSGSGLTQASPRRRKKVGRDDERTNENTICICDLLIASATSRMFVISPTVSLC